MNNHPDQKYADSLDAIRRLYPGLSDQELEEARQRLDDYAALAIRIAHRIENDPEAYEQFKKLLDEKRKTAL